MEEAEVIQKAGLSPNEAKVYLALIETGETSVGLLSEKADIDRRAIYDALKRLIEKGLVGFLHEGKKRYFKALSPHNLLLLLNDREAAVREVLPTLESRFESRRQETSIDILRGKGGLRTLFEDMLSVPKGGEILMLGTGGGNVEKRYLPYFMPRFHRMRIAKGIRERIIYRDTEYAKEKAREKGASTLSEVRFMPENILNPAVIQIWENKVAIHPRMSCADVKERLIILIEGKENADSFRDYFNWIWAISKRSDDIQHAKGGSENVNVH